MGIPERIKRAAIRSRKTLLFTIIPFVCWELLSDRLSSWANSKIDEQAAGVMRWLAEFIGEAAVAPLGFTIAFAIIVMVIIYAHAYVSENKDNITKKASQKHKKQESTFEDDFNYFADLKESDSQPLLQPDIEMTDAYEYLASLLFPDSPPNVHNVDVENPKIANLLTQKLRSGELRSWGLYLGESVEREFRKEDWKYRELHPIKASIPYKNEAQTKTVMPEGNPPLTGLRVNFNQLQTIWPKQKITGTAPVSDKHNVSLLEAIHYVASGKWGNVRAILKSENVHVTNEEIKSIENAFDDIRQFAINGDIRIWGEDSKGHYMLIEDNTYWKRHWLNWTQILAADNENDWGLDDLLGDNSNDQSRKDELYHKYRTSKQDIEKLWPPGVTPTRQGQFPEMGRLKEA